MLLPYTTTRSHVQYALEEKNEQNWTLKVSRQAKKIEIPKQEFQSYDVPGGWTQDSFGQFLGALVQKKILFPEDVPPVLFADLQARVKKVEESNGDIALAFEKLVKSAKENTTIPTLQEAVEITKYEYLKCLQQQKQTRLNLQKLSQKINNLLVNTYRSFKYLTDGPGKYEEHEICYSDEEKEYKQYRSSFEKAVSKYKVKGSDPEKQSKELILEEIKTCLEEVDTPLNLLLDSNLYYKKKFAAIQAAFTFQRRLRELFQQLKCSDDEEISYHFDDFINWLRDFVQKIAEFTAFGAHLARRVIFNAIKKYSGNDPLATIKKFRDMRVALESQCQFLQEMDDEPNTNLDGDIQDNIEKVIIAFQQLIQDIVENLENKQHEFDNLRCDEWGGNEKFENKVLEAEIVDLCSLDTSLGHWKDELIQFFKNAKGYQDKKSDFDITSAAYDESYKKLMKSLKLLKTSVDQKNKSLPAAIDALKTSRQNLQEKSFIDQENGAIDEVLSLSRKERLKVEEKSNDKKELVLQRGECHNKIEQAIAESNHEDALDLAIEWTRLDRKIESLERELENQQIDVVKQFHGMVDNGSQFDPNSSYAFSKYKKNGSSVVVGARSVHSHPVKSPLVHLVSTISRQQIGVSGYEGFLLSSNNPLSFFERGMFEVLGKKNPEKMLGTSSLYQNVCQAVPPSQPTSCNNVDFPDYYSAFVWNSPNHFQLEALNKRFPDSYFEIYTVLVMKVAHLFMDQNRRTRFNLPDGNPIACILVSNTGEILSWGVNTTLGKEKDPIRHAEVNAVGAYFLKHPDKTHLPENSVLFTSLKSCHMCAGIIYDSKKSEFPIEVKYAQTDPTQNNTVIHGFEAKIEHPMVLEIDATYKTLKNKKHDLNAASSLKEPEFQHSLAKLGDRLNQVLTSIKDAPLLTKEVNDFLNAISS